MRSIVVLCLVFTGCFKLVANSGDDLSPPAGADLAPPAGVQDMGGPALAIVGGGELQAVTTDQSLVAYQSSASTINGVVAGSLVTAPLPAGAPTTAVGVNAWAASFGSQSSVLLYLTGPTASTDPGSTAVYGALNLWKPGQTVGVRLSTGFAPLRTTPFNNKWTMYWDVAGPSLAGSGDVRLVRSADCTATACTPVTVAAAVSHVTAMNVSGDGSYAAYVVNNGGTPVTYDVYLVNEATGVATRVVAGGPSTSTSFSPDGALFAAVGPAGALQVLSSATGAAAAWAALPAGAKAQQVLFADPTTLVVRALPTGTTTSTVYLTMATTAVTLASGIVAMELPRNTSGPTATARFAFLTTAISTGVGDVVGYDLSAVSPVAIPVASSALVSSSQVSYDQTYVHVLEDYDTSSLTGTLIAVSLPDGTPTTLASGVTSSGSASAGQHGLFFLDGTATLGSWFDGTFTTYAAGVSQFRVRSSPEANVYFSVDGSDTVYGYGPGIYVAAQ